jgi:hypothetical protein
VGAEQGASLPRPALQIVRWFHSQGDFRLSQTHPITASPPRLRGTVVESGRDGRGATCTPCNVSRLAAVTPKAVLDDKIGHGEKPAALRQKGSHYEVRKTRIYKPFSRIFSMACAA